MNFQAWDHVIDCNVMELQCDWLNHLTGVDSSRLGQTTVHMIGTVFDLVNWAFLMDNSAS